VVVVVCSTDVVLGVVVSRIGKIAKGFFIFGADPGGDGR